MTKNTSALHRTFFSPLESRRLADGITEHAAFQREGCCKQAQPQAPAASSHDPGYGRTWFSQTADVQRDCVNVPRQAACVKAWTSCPVKSQAFSPRLPLENELASGVSASASPRNTIRLERICLVALPSSSPLHTTDWCPAKSFLP